MATTSGSDGRLAFIIVVAYAFAYALAALFIQRRFLSRRPPKLAGLLAVLLPAGWALAPSIFLFFANRLSWRSVDGLQLGNIFNVMGSHGDQDLIYHLYFACGWVLVVLVLNAKWFGQQLRNFVPPPNPAPPPAPTALPPVITQ